MWKRQVANFLKRIIVRIPVDERFLGRWSILHDDRAFERVDRTNEDHCGACGSLLEKYRSQNEQAPEDQAPEDQTPNKQAQTCSSRK